MRFSLVAGVAVVAAVGLAGGTVAGAPSSLAVDPAIAGLVDEVSATRLRADDAQLITFGTRNTFATFDSRRRGVVAARNWITARLREIARTSDGRMTVMLDSYTQPKTDRTPRAVEISSVIATLRGDDPSGRTYVVSSHYDSRNTDVNDASRDAPGADDNASGVACVLEAARVLAPRRLRGTILFAAYDGEEQGLWGSAHHARMLRQAGVRVEGAINNDIIGASNDGTERSPGDVRLFSEALPLGADPRRVNLLGTENDSPSRELARFVKDAAERYVPSMHADLVYRADRFLRGGDQESFTEQGFPAVRFVEAHENFAHQHQDVRVENGVQYGDLIEFMDFDYLARITRMNVAALASLALAPARPADAGILTRQLTSDTTLQWSAVPDAARYEIVWRGTTDPTWTHARDVGNVTSVTLAHMSKDDWLFGVRAVDAGGHAGVVAFPAPIR